MDCIRDFCWVSFVLIASVGCGGGDLGKVSGIVTMDGQPVPNVSLEFTPEDGGRPSIGRTDQNGEYEAYYTHDQRGVEIGLHLVRFQVLAASGDVSEEDELTPPSSQEGGGSDVAVGRKLSPANVDVKSGRNEFDFELIEK